MAARLYIFYILLKQEVTGVPGVGDQRRHLAGTRENVPAGLWWCTWAHISRSWWLPYSHVYIYIYNYIYNII